MGETVVIFLFCYQLPCELDFLVINGVLGFLSFEVRVRWQIRDNLFCSV